MKPNRETMIKKKKKNLRVQSRFSPVLTNDEPLLTRQTHEPTGTRPLQPWGVVTWFVTFTHCHWALGQPQRAKTSIKNETQQRKRSRKNKILLRICSIPKVGVEGGRTAVSWPCGGSKVMCQVLLNILFPKSAPKTNNSVLTLLMKKLRDGRLLAQVTPSW